MSNKQLVTFLVECIVNTTIVQVYVQYNPDLLNYLWPSLMALSILCGITALTHCVVQVIYLIIKYPILLYYKTVVQYKEIIFNTSVQPSGIITNSTLSKSAPLPINSMFNYKTKIKTIYPWFEHEYNLDRYKVLTNLDKVKLL